jgi:hypothetical protein
MAKYLTFYILLSSLLLGTAAHAQVAFSVGPQVGLTASGQAGRQYMYTTSSYRPGFEVGLQGILQFGHLAVQPSLRFVQKGLHRRTAFVTDERQQDYRLNYLVLPINLAYSLGQHGRGLQLLAGPYAGLLLGGHYHSTYLDVPNGLDFSQDGQVRAGDYQPIPRSPTDPTDDQYTRRFDMGVQAGLGYRFGKLLAQAEFSFGLRDLAPMLTSSYNRTAQLSLSYLVTPGR